MDFAIIKEAASEQNKYLATINSNNISKKVISFLT